MVHEQGRRVGLHPYIFTHRKAIADNVFVQEPFQVLGAPWGTQRGSGLDLHHLGQSQKPFFVAHKPMRRVSFQKEVTLGDRRVVQSFMCAAMDAAVHCRWEEEQHTSTRTSASAAPPRMPLCLPHNFSEKDNWSNSEKNLCAENDLSCTVRLMPVDSGCKGVTQRCVLPAQRRGGWIKFVLWLKSKRFEIFVQTCGTLFLYFDETAPFVR